MINNFAFKGIYLYKAPIDFRKSICSLQDFILGEMEHSLEQNVLFIFSNKNHNRIKVIYRDNSGVAMWYKVLDENKFKWPAFQSEKIIYMTEAELKNLLSILDFKAAKKINRNQLKIAA